MLLGALLLSLLVTPEQQVAPPDLAPETSTVYRIDAASNGDGWLVVRGENGVVANRLDHNGQLLERLPIAVGDGGTLSSPAVACGANEYLVAWTEHDTIRAAFIDADGNLSPSFLVSAQANTALMRQISCAFDGSHFVIVWSESNVPNRTVFFRTKFAAIVDPGGSIVATDTALGQGLTSDYFGLTGRHNDFLVVTSAGTAVVGFTIDNNGRVTPHGLGTSDTYNLHPFAAFNGSATLVLWDRPGLASLTATGQTFTATMAAAGALRAVVLDENGVEQRASTIDQAPDHDFTPVAAAWNGTALLAAYGKQVAGIGTVYAKIVDAPDPAEAIAFAPPSQTAPAIAAANDREALTVWTEREEASSGFRARAALLRDGIPSAPIDLGPSAASASVAFGAPEYLVVWSRHDDDCVIEGRRVARDGTPLDTAPFPILRASIAQPAVVAFDGENFVVAAVTYASAADLGSVVAVRVRPDGTVLDPDGVVVHQASGFQRLLAPPVIASNGESTLILWREQEELFAAPLGGGATKIAGPVDVAPSVAWTGTTYIVSWTDIVAHALRWTALDASGNPAGTPGALPLAAANQIDPTATARLGDGALVAWVDISAGNDTNIRALRVAADGSMQSQPFTVAGSALPESAVAATGGESGARVAYQRATDFPGTSGLPRVFTRAIVETLPRRRAAGR